MNQFTRTPSGAALPPSKIKRIDGPVMHRVNVRYKNGQEDSYSYSVKAMAMEALHRLAARDDVADARYLDPEKTEEKKS